MPVREEKKVYRTFILSTGLVIALTFVGTFFLMAVQTRELIQEQNLLQARVLFSSIVLTRKWNAQYGGVYVEKKAGVESNPYLENPDIRTVDGRVFTARNPALMTREISEYAEKQGAFKFHLTSLRPLNPNNAPDAFERDALERFALKAEREVFRTEQMNKRSYFRYMAPLYVDKECLQCHAKQGYAVGEVRGGISVSFDIHDQQKKIVANTRFIIVSGIATAVVLLCLIYYFMARLIKSLANARQTIEKIAITDELTGLFNRRHLMSRFAEEFEKVKRLDTKLSCIIADIDHFKAVNDHYGHLAGDAMLREVSHRLKNIVRAYDIVGRYGGEEFLVILPDTGLADAKHFAERIRIHIKEKNIVSAAITISLGVTEMRADDSSVDEVLKRADDNLYKAKNAGRDRVE